MSPCLTLLFALKLSSNLSNSASSVLDGYCTFLCHGHSTLLSSCGSSRLAAVTVKCHCAHLPQQSPPLQRRSHPRSCSGQISLSVATHLILIAVLCKHTQSSKFCGSTDIPRRPRGEASAPAPLFLYFSLAFQKWTGKCWHQVKMPSFQALASLGTGGRLHSCSGLPDFLRS